MKKIIGALFMLLAVASVSHVSAEPAVMCTIHEGINLVKDIPWMDSFELIHYCNFPETGMCLLAIVPVASLDFNEITAFSEHEIAALKVKYGNKLYYFAVEDMDGEIFHFMAKRPDRSLIDMISRYSINKEIDKVNDALAKNLIIWSSNNEALEDGTIYLGVIENLSTLITPAKDFLAKS